jgi:hypothetical protein
MHSLRTLYQKIFKLFLRPFIFAETIFEKYATIGDKPYLARFIACYYRKKFSGKQILQYANLPISTVLRYLNKRLNPH